jgi:hypothetical protein
MVIEFSQSEVPLTLMPIKLGDLLRKSFQRKPANAYAPQRKLPKQVNPENPKGRNSIQFTRAPGAPTYRN